MKVEVIYDYQYYVKYELSAKYHLEEALQASRQYKDNLSFVNMVAHCYYYLNDYFNALDFVLQAHHLDEANKNADEYYYTLKLTGDIYSKLSIYESAVYYYLEALKELGTSDIKRKECDILRHLARVYMEMRSPDLAMDYAVEALQLAELLHDEQLIGDANLTLCQLSGQRKLYEKAFKYGFKSVEMYKEINDEKGLVLIYLEIASLYAKENNNEFSNISMKRLLCYRQILIITVELFLQISCWGGCFIKKVIKDGRCLFWKKPWPILDVATYKSIRWIYITCSQKCMPISVTTNWHITHIRQEPS